MGYGQGALVFGTAGAFVLFGVTLGVVAFENAMLDAGAFSSYCKADDPERPCRTQHVLLSQAFQSFSIWGNLAAWPVGALSDRWGPFGLCRAMIVLCAFGFAISGISIESGWAFVVGMSLASIGGASVNTLAIGSIVPLATRGNHRRRYRWTGIVSSAVDIGYASAVPVGFLLDWHVLPTSVWYVIVAAAIVAVFLPWHQVTVMPLRERALQFFPSQRRAAEEGEGGGPPPVEEAVEVVAHDMCSPQGSLRYLKNVRLWVAIAQFASSLIVVGSAVAAAGRIAPFFGLSSRVATAYAPLVIGASGLLYLVVAALGLTHHQRLMFVLRLVFLGGFVACLSIDAWRAPATFWIALGCASTWRTMGLVVSTQAGSHIGHGGEEGLVVGMLIFFAGLSAFFLGQPMTYLMGVSPHNLTLCMLGMGAVAVLVEIAMFDLMMKLLVEHEQMVAAQSLEGSTMSRDGSLLSPKSPTALEQSLSDSMGPWHR